MRIALLMAAVLGGCTPDKPEETVAPAPAPAVSAVVSRPAAIVESKQEKPGTPPPAGAAKETTPPATKTPAPAAGSAPAAAAGIPPPEQGSGAASEGDVQLVDPANPDCRLAPVPDLTRSGTYAGMPFRAGEEADYELDYGSVHVGYGHLRVENPVKHEIIAHYDAGGKPVKRSAWHMLFSARAYTGDWYSGIYSGAHKVRGFSRPWDFGISKFYLEERAGTLVGSVHKKKYFDFYQGRCQVVVKENDLEKKKTKNGNHRLQYGALDTLGGFYKLRTLSYDKGPVRFTVYASEKNWTLEAVPLGVEKVTVPAGTFQADKLNLKTYVDGKAEQRGVLRVWVARSHPARPLVKIEGEFKFGNITLELQKFKPGV